MIQSETERQFYLGTAGIRLWYAREPLPGSAPSPEFVFIEDETEPRSEALPTPGEPVSKSPESNRPVRGGHEAGAARIASLQALMDRSPGVSGEAAPEVAPPERSEEDQAALPESPESSVATEVVDKNLPVRLNLQIWMGRQFALMAGLSDEASVRLQETLALNILKSLGEESPLSLGVVRWPVFNNRVAPGNSMADLRSVMSHVVSRLDGQKVLALGGMAPGNTELSLADLVPSVTPDVVFPHSLAELAADPAVKRMLWHEIKPLAGN